MISIICSRSCREWFILLVGLLSNLYASHCQERAGQHRRNPLHQHQ